jgi:hypothetical protein
MVSHAFICADTNTKWFPGRANRKCQQSIEKITLLKTQENEMAAGVLGSHGSAAQTVSELSCWNHSRWMRKDLCFHSKMFAQSVLLHSLRLRRRLHISLPLISARLRFNHPIITRDGARCLLFLEGGNLHSLDRTSFLQWFGVVRGKHSFPLALEGKKWCNGAQIGS